MEKIELTDADYDLYRRNRKMYCFPDEIGIDMPVHGEFERNDMVEYFGESLEGCAFTSNGGYKVLDLVT